LNISPLYRYFLTKKIMATGSMSYNPMQIDGDGTAVGNVDDNISFLNLNGFTAGSGKMIDTDKTALTGKAGLLVYFDGVLYGYIPIVTGASSFSGEGIDAVSCAPHL